MATMPNVTAIRPVPQSRRQIVGAQSSGIPQAIGQFANAVGQVVDAQEKERDAQAVFAARRQLDEWERKALFDPKDGAVNKRGADAFDIPQRLTQDFDRVAGEVSQGLGSERQRQAFRDVLESRRGQITSWADRHAQKERESYDHGEYESDISTMTDRAAMFPEKAAAEIDQIERRTIGYMRSKGRSEAEINASLVQQRDKAHAQVLNSLLASGEESAALKYFEANKAAMTADTAARGEAAIRQATTLNAAQTNATEVMARGIPMDQALAETREKFKGNGKAQELAVAQVKTRYVEREAIAKQAENGAYETARLHIERGQAIPLKVWQGMDDGHRADVISAQRARADALDAKNRGKPIQTDWATYTRLRDFAVKNPDAFVADDLGKYASYIAGPQLEQLQDLKDKLSTPTAAKDTIALQKQVAAATAALRLSGKAGEEKRGQLQSAIYDAVDAAQAAKGGRALSFSERQAEIDKLLVAGEVESGHWWQSDPDVRLYEIAGDPEKRAKFAPTISDADRVAIVKRFQLRGVNNPTADQINAAYKAWKKL